MCRANKTAKMAADTFFTVQLRSAAFKSNSLMSAVTAGDKASSAADTFFSIEFREKYRISFKAVCRITYLIKS